MCFVLIRRMMPIIVIHIYFPYRSYLNLLIEAKLIFATYLRSHNICISVYNHFYFVCTSRSIRHITNTIRCLNFYSYMLAASHAIDCGRSAELAKLAALTMMPME